VDLELLIIDLDFDYSLSHAEEGIMLPIRLAVREHTLRRTRTTETGERIRDPLEDQIAEPVDVHYPSFSGRFGCA
jgi:hypothetical protein